MTTNDIFATDTEKKRNDLKDQSHSLSPDEKIDLASEDSMDASDPPATTTPGDRGDPAPSSGFRDDDA